MRGRQLIAALLICAGGLVACGSGSYKGSSYGGASGPRTMVSFAAGRGEVSRDTLTIVFTTQDVLTAGALDTAKVGTASSRNAPWDSRRRDTFKFWLARADTIHRLGNGFKVTNFAYGMVDTTEPEGYGLPSGDQVGLQAGLRTGSGPYSHNRTYNIAGRRSELFYIPFEKYIPSNVTVVDAFVNVSSTTNASATTADSIYANLVTTPDSKWYTARRGGDRPDYSKMGWSRQISNNPTGSVTWSATNSDPWTPSLSERAGFRYWGDVEDQTALPGAIASRQQVQLSITNCVQAAVSGATNNGIKLDLGWKSNAFQGAFVHAFWDDYSSALARTPYVVVRYVRKAYIGTADLTAPPPPGILAATAGNGNVSLTWSSGGPGTSAFRIYRYFDGGTTSLVATRGVASHVDNTAINGTEHFYRVSAIDASGNESALSSAASAVPGTIRVIQDPAYYALWFQDPGASLTSAQKDSLAAFDMIVTGPFPMEGGVSEPAYNGLLADLRARNGDIVVLSYIHPWAPRLSWETEAARTAQRKIWDWLDGEDAFAKTIGGSYIEGSTYPTRVANVMVPGVADAIARFWVAAFDSTGVDGEYAGLFVDDVVPDFPSFYCFSGACDDSLDMDQDGTPYSADSDEQAAWGQYHVDFATALRREFAERGMANRILVANTTYTQHAEHDEAEDLLELYDGSMNEGWNRWWPGNADDLDHVHWPMIETIADNFPRSQLAPTPVLWQSHIDSSLGYVSEPVAMAARGWVCAQNNYNETWGKYGNDAIPAMVRRLADPGTFTDMAIQAGAGDNPDTLTSTWSAMTARLVLDRNAAASATDTFAVWPYLVIAAGDTVSRSIYWEGAGDVGAPLPDLQYHTTAGDREIAVRILPSALSDNTTWLPRDFSHFRIVRESKPASVVIRDTFIVAADTLAVMWDEPESYLWMSTGLTNGVEYKHKIVSVDVLGNASAERFFVDQNRRPVDITAPASPQDIVAAGGSGYVDVDWAYPSKPADFLRFRVWRRQHVAGGAFALHDSVTISAHQDSVAVSGVEYDYYVVAVDDDGNASAPSDTVTGAWFGTAPVTYAPPSQVRVIQDYTPRTTAVVIYPPSDQTGLTGYTVYRGPWNIVAAPDTTVCIRRFTGLTPDGFGGAVYLDAQNVSVDPDSAFQYTAVALYSGHASDKYAVPATAFSTGGFAFSTPTCAAYGTGSNIGVAVVTVAGADSTRIYRGTSVGSQTFLAGVAAANNPYTDSTAAANTDYYYKVRQYDNETATWTQYSAVSGPVRWTSVPSGDPSVSSVTGSVSNGSTITITGSNFGAVASPEFVIYDDLETGAQSPLWESDASNPPFADVPIVAATVGLRRHAGSGYHGQHLFTGDRSIIDSHGTFRDGVASRTFFGGYWFRLADNWAWGASGASNGTVGASLSNVKFLRLSTAGSVDDWTIAVHPYSGSGIWSTAVSATCNASVTSEAGYCCGEWAGWDDGAWHHVQFEWVDSSTAGAADARFKVWVDGQLVDEAAGFIGMKCAAGGYKRIYGLGFYDSWADSSSDPNKSVPYAFYIDDIYYDTQLARVELGNASTYGACTHREIQIPSAWSATSITCTVNAGTLTGSGKYLFVINADGTASVGYPVTLP